MQILPKHLDICVYKKGDVFILEPSSFTKDYMVVYEYPVEEISIFSSNREVGEAILRATNRCRGEVDEPATKSEEHAKKLGFKSWGKLHKAIVASLGYREKFNGYFHFNPILFKGRYVLFNDTHFEASIDNPEEIGIALRKAISETERLNT